MRRPPFLAGCESAIRLMATTLLLPPAVDQTDAGACIDRWREQRIAEIAIVEFGDEARAQASDRLRQVAGAAEREAIPPAPPVSMTERRDGARVSGEPIIEGAGGLREVTDRQIRVVGDLAFIPLTQGKEAIIDAADLPLVSHRKWYARLSDNVWYALSKSHVHEGKPTRTIQLHRVIAGEPDGMEVDHRNRDGLLCTRDNLRVATRLQNARNRRANYHRSAPFKGIQETKSGKWRARIRAGGAKIHIGLFNTAEEAHVAYCRAAEEFHGEFARTS